MSIRLVLFDLDDVLYHYDRHVRIAVIAAATGLDASWIEDRIWGDGLEDAADAGGFADTASYLAAWSRALGAEIDRDLWVEARRRSMTPIPGSLDILRRLVGMEGVEVAILTNNGHMVYDERHVLAPDAAALVGETFFVSSGFKLAKPDPAIYRAVLDRLDVAPASAIFIDDKPENVLGAEKAGLLGHRFQDADRLEDALRNVFGERWSP